jgi:hypothetical protein
VVGKLRIAVPPCVVACLKDSVHVRPAERALAYGSPVALGPDSSTQPSGAGAQTSTRVATVQKDGSIALDFGGLQQGDDEVYADVLELTSEVGGTVVLNVTLSGPVAKLVKHVGYWQGATRPWIVSTGGHRNGSTTHARARKLRGRD